VCVREGEREGKSVCVSMCMCEREREQQSELTPDYRSVTFCSMATLA